MSLSTIDESGPECGTVDPTDREHGNYGDSDSDTLGEPTSRNSKKSSLEADRPHNPIEQADGTIRDAETTSSNETRHKLDLEKTEATTPIPGLNPTSARFRIRFKEEFDKQRPLSVGPASAGREDLADEVSMRWSSRYNRKGRNSFVVSRRSSTGLPGTSERAHKLKSNAVRIGKNIFRMFFTFPYWDMAFWSGWAYSWGSVLFVIDGCFAWVPLAFPYTEFPGESYSVGLLFFFGALLYEVGAVVAYLEAINDGSFHGSAMKRFLEGHEDEQKRLLDEKLHAFFGHFVPGHLHKSSRNKKKKKKKQIGRLANAVDVEAGWDPANLKTLEELDSHYRPRRGGIDYGAAAEEEQTTEYLPWCWWPTWQNFKAHHLREIGWWACSIQLLGATLYGITGIVALPGILDHLKYWQELGAYWVPQIVASLCFLTASLLFTFETQEKWYKPEPRVLGWWVGFWSGVGSMGFLLCACFGVPSNKSSWAEYQSGLSSTWGSFAYLISGLLQWYEAVNKNPIAELFTEPGRLKSFQVHL